MVGEEPFTDLLNQLTSPRRNTNKCEKEEEAEQPQGIFFGLI